MAKTKKTNKLLWLGLAVAGVWYFLFRKPATTTEGVSLEILDPEGNPIPQRLTQDVIDRAIQRASMSSSGQIGAFPGVEGQEHTVIATITNQSTKGGVAVDAPFSATMQGGSTAPIFTFSPSGHIGDLPANGQVQRSWTFTPTFPSGASGSVNCSCTCTVMIGPSGDQVQKVATMYFTITVIQTIYGATVVLSQG